MSSEQYTKLRDLLDRQEFEALIRDLATMDYLVFNYYNKDMVDAKEVSLQNDIDTKEALSNKATDFSVVDDTKYPTTKAVSERLLNLPIAELNNHTLREVFGEGNLIANQDPQTWTISSGTDITGDIKSTGDIRIDGNLKGNLSTKGKVILGNTGKVNGEVHCRNFEIEGSLEGKIFVSDLLSLRAKSKVFGDISTIKLAIEPGAFFTGKCDMSGISHSDGGKTTEAKEK